MLKNTKLDSKKQKKLLSVPKEESTSLCGLCRGTKLLCGRSRCPVLVKFHSRDKVTPLIDKLSLGGSSPPSVFIGRFGYPKVSIGPMIPPVMGDTSLIDTPELWFQLVNQPVNHVHKEEISYEVNSVNQAVNHKQQEKTTETVNQVNWPVNHEIQVTENYDYDILEYLRCDNKGLWNRAELIFERMDNKPEREKPGISWFRM